MRKAALNKPCPICTKPMVELKNIVIDHNHSTGEVRGCICRWCNANGGRAENAAIRAKRELTPVEWLTRWTEWIDTAECHRILEMEELTLTARTIGRNCKWQIRYPLIRDNS